MILHKLLFFKLPYRLRAFIYIYVSDGDFLILFLLLLYRYAATGDADGEPISREDEFEKMERLEKEVLDYPGSVFFFLFYSKKSLILS